MRAMSKPGSPWRHLGWVPLLALSVCAAALPEAPASANPRPALTLVSGKDPLPAAGTSGACGSTADFQGWEQEPTLALDPTDESHLVAAWIQDYADAIVTASSTDGGRSWTVAVPRTVACTGGAAQYGEGSSAIDPMLSYGPADRITGRRTVYLSSVLKSASAVGPLTYAVVVHQSTDNGRTWSDPVTVARAAAPEYLDGTSLVADAANPGRAFVAWQQGDLTLASRQQLVSRTDDGGATWSVGLPIPTGGFPVSGRLQVLRDGTLINVLSSIPSPTPGTPRNELTGPTTLLAVSSTDLGLTWTSAVKIAVADDTHLAIASSAVGPDGTVYVSWQGSVSEGYSILLSRSSTAGRSWSPPTLVATEAGDPLLELFASPELAVSSDGTVAVGFYDHRNATAASPGTSDYWLRTSRPNSSWREQHVAGPFDVTRAPLGFLGDYQGIVPLSNGFGLALALTGPAVATPPTDIFWVTTTG